MQLASPLSVVAAMVSVTALCNAQAIVEIPAPTVATSLVDFNTFPVGPTSVAAIQAVAPSIANLQLLPSTAAAGAYDTNPVHQALALGAGGLEILSPVGAPPFVAFNAQIDFTGPCTEFGFGIGDWNGPMIIDFYSGGSIVTTYTTTAYSATLLYNVYQMQGGATFDRVDIRASTTGGNWVFQWKMDVQLLTGLFPNFTATPTTGPSPLTVNFTDTSFASPSTVVGWSWNFGDGSPTSNMQNPVHVYPLCGNYTVALTVVDSVGAMATETKTNFITTDVVTPSFTYAVMPGGVVQFTDTSTPTPDTWSWDLDGDGLPDSSLQNPTWTYSSPCTSVNVTLSASLLCQGPFNYSEQVVIAGTSLATQFTGGNGTSSASYVGNMFDVSVTAPDGINVCAVNNATWTMTGPFDLSVYVTEDTYLGKDATASEWRLVATGSGVANGGTTTAPSINFVGLTPFHMPQGDFGVAVLWTIPTGGTAYVTYSNGPLGPFTSPELTIVPNPATAPGISKYNLFGAGNFSPRVWNGEIFYTNCTASGEGGYGFYKQGCVSSLGTVPTNTALAPPKLGVGVTMEISGMPAPEGMFFCIGFSTTNWPQFGNSPLPFDLAQFGMPGCTNYISTESADFIAGSGGTAQAFASIVNTPSLLCTRFYTVALVLDSTANPLGGVLSDTASGVIGN